MKLKVLDLFSGIGMFSYGLEKTSLYETVAFCEYDKKCRAVLRKYWPDVYCYSDITKLKYSNNSFYSDQDKVVLSTPIDLIVGGFPCQDLSVANRYGKGLEGSRSGLWVDYKRLIQEVKPKGVIVENVSNLLNKGLSTLLKDLDSLGYDAEWHCITAKHLGACHQRDRLFILAYSRSFGRQRFEPLQHIEKVGQGWESWKETLQQIYSDPFRRSCSYPQPLLRRVDVSNTGGMDRLKQLGNTIYWPIVERIGYHMYENINETS